MTTRPVRTHCVLCGGPFAITPRAPQPCRHARSGYVASRRSWCTACDTIDAPLRAARASARERARDERAVRQAYMREYNARPEVQARKRQQKAAARFATRKSFRCGACAGRFAGNREAYRMVDGVRVRLGLCPYCAEQRHGPAKAKAPRAGWAEYQRERRARQRAMRGNADAA